MTSARARYAGRRLSGGVPRVPEREAIAAAVPALLLVLAAALVGASVRGRRGTRGSGARPAGDAAASRAGPRDRGGARRAARRPRRARLRPAARVQAGGEQQRRDAGLARELPPRGDAPARASGPRVAARRWAADADLLESVHAARRGAARRRVRHDRLRLARRTRSPRSSCATRGAARCSPAARIGASSPAACSSPRAPWST